MRTNTGVAFWLALLCTLLCPLFFPKYHLFFFVPYLVVCFYRHSRFAVLWRAFGCGVIIDLLSSGPFFGFSSLNYCFVSFFLFGQTRNFFEDKLSTLPLMTFLFSFLSTGLSLILALFFGNGYPLSGVWIVTDLIGMPFADATYALLVFSLPFQLVYGLKKIRFHT